MRSAPKPIFASVVALRPTELPEAAACLLLAFVTPGKTLAATASTSRSWAQAARHPELWRWLCTRGCMPLVKPGQRHMAQRCFAGDSAAAWHELALGSRGVITSGWLGLLPPCHLVELLKVLQHDGSGWIALTTLVSQRSGSPGEVETETTSTSSDTLTCSQVRVKRISSPVLQCSSLFPLYGGFSISLEEPDGADTKDHDGRGRPFWVTISSPPSGPVSLHILLVLPTADEAPHRRDDPFESQVVDIRLQLRADAGLGRRLDGLSEAAPLDALRRAVRMGTVSALIRAAEPDCDTEGYPGGSGWIPWTPAKPTVCFLQF